MGSVYDRMKVAGPLWNEMKDRFNALVNGYNGMRYFIKALNPHITNDEQNAAAAADPYLDTAEEMQNAHAALETAYTAHIASTDYHAAADNANGLTAISTPKQAMDLLNDIKTKFNLHRVLRGGPPACHGAADATNVVAAANATTKATAIALANAIRTAYEAHRVLTDGAVHGTAADATNVVTVAALAGTATWAQVAALADDLRTQYEAHRVLVAGGVHGAADATNTAAVAAVGVVLTRDMAFINGFQAKYNAHWALTTAHVVIDQSFRIGAATAADLAGAIAMTVEAITDYRAHISRTAFINAMYPEILPI